jgi:hypothetical protein
MTGVYQHFTKQVGLKLLYPITPGFLLMELLKVKKYWL